MADVTNAELAAQITAFVDAVAVREEEVSAWVTGTADGGPAGDGFYPITDLTGFVHVVASPARIRADATGILGGLLSFATWAELAAFPTAGLTEAYGAKVYADGGTHTDPVSGATGTANEGVFRLKKSAPSGWERIANLEAVDAATTAATAAAALAAVNVGIVNAWPDPFLRETPRTGRYRGKVRMDRISGTGWALTSPAASANAPYDGRTFKYSGSGLPSLYLYCDEAGLSVGDTLQFATEWIGTGTTVTMFCRWQDSRGVNITAQETESSAVTVDLSMPRTLTGSSVMPAGAVRLMVYFSFTGGTSTDCELIAVWAARRTSGIGDKPLIATPEQRSEFDYLLTEKVRYDDAVSVLTPTDVSVKSRPLPFKGWAQVMTPAGVSFDAIRIAALTVDPSAVAMRCIVRTGASDTHSTALGAVNIAFGDVEIPGTDGAITGLVIPLLDWLTGEPVVLADADLLAQYFVGLWPVDANGVPVRCDEPVGTMPNRVALSYYIDTSTPETDTWKAYTGNGPIAVEHVKLTNPAQGWAVSRAAREDILSEVAGAGTSSGIEIKGLPAKVYGTEGIETSIQLDNLVFEDADKLYWSADGTEGTLLDEKWSLTPTATLLSGTALTLKAIDQRCGALLASRATTIHTAKAASSNAAKKLLVIGDSTVAAGTMTQRILDRSTADTHLAISLLGTKGAGANQHDGVGGTTVAGWYGTDLSANGSTNPYYNPGSLVFDFAYYITNTAQADPDYVAFQLGINDVISATLDGDVTARFASAATKLEAMIDSIQAHSAAINVVLNCPFLPAAHQDAFGASYGLTYKRWRQKRNILIWNDLLIGQFEGREGEGIYVNPAHLWIDSDHNFPRAAAAPYNAETADTIERQNNGVHPTETGSAAGGGYLRAGDALFSLLKVLNP